MVSKLFGIPFGGRNPFTADVWFVNKRAPLDIDWKISKIIVSDPQFKYVPLVASGRYGLRVENSSRFLTELVGTVSTFDKKQITDHFSAMIEQYTKNAIVDYMRGNNVPVTEIRRWLVHEFLTRTGSDVDFRNMDGLRLYRTLRIVRGPDENIRPVNIGLLMFTEKPGRYFRNAHIEIVNMPDPKGTDMTREMFDGPVDEQIRMALRTIRGLYIREKVIKVPGQAEPLRVFNYPYEALEETLVNAVYHKDYMIPEPVKMYIHPDRIEVVNFPGPDRSITDKMIARCDMRCDVSLNGRLGDFLKELKLAEGRNTGIPKVIRSLEDNGSGMPTYLTDPERRFLRVTIPVHDLFLKDIEKPKPAKTSKYRAPEDTKVAILESLRQNGCQSGRELAASVGYSSVNNTFRRCLEELMVSGDVEYMYPDNPKDSRQRICLSKR